MDLLSLFPAAWVPCLSEQTQTVILPNLAAFLERECQDQIVYPPKSQWFSAFEALTPDQVKIVIIGQDPYHGPNQGNGLAFSVNEGIKIPPSLMNIYKELQSDLGIVPAKTGNLAPWVQQGILLMNTVLTVRASAANSHKNKGWEAVTDDIINCLGARPNPVVFVLWGANAQRFKEKIGQQHYIIESAHPSPLSAYRGFLGSQPFSQINDWLTKNNSKPINWML